MKKIVSLIVTVGLLTLIITSTTTVHSDNITEEYQKIINEYIGAYELCLNINSGQTRYDEEVFSNSFPAVNYEYITEALNPPSTKVFPDWTTPRPQYLLKDIDGDSQAELFIGIDPNQNYPSSNNNQCLYGVYTYKNGKVTDLFGKYIGYRDCVYLLNDNTLLRTGDGGYQDGFSAIYVLSGTICKSYEEIEVIAGNFYYDGSVITQSNAVDVLEGWNSKILNIEWEDIYNYRRTITVLLNGKKIEFDQPPIMAEGDRVMVPMRTIFEELGYNVSWYQYGNGNAYAVKGNNYIDVFIGEHYIEYSRNGKEDSYYCDVVPQIINERTLVPVRAIAECAGCTVEWDGANSTVIITSYNDGTPTAKPVTVTPAPPTATLPPNLENDIAAE